MPKSTFINRLDGIQPRSETHASGHKLTAIEEESLVKQLLNADKQGFSVRPEFLRGMAQILLRERTKDPTAVLGVNWASSFIKHRPELHTRYNRRITYQRAKQEDPKVLKQWFGTVHDAIKEHGIHEDDIWNFDETGQGQIGRRITQGATYSFDMPRTLFTNWGWSSIIGTGGPP